jgi:hypothetical protein
MHTKFGSKTEGKRPQERARRRWDYDIKMDIKETGLESVDWINLVYDRNQWRALANIVMNLQLTFNKM